MGGVGMSKGRGILPGKSWGWLLKVTTSKAPDFPCVGPPHVPLSSFGHQPFGFLMRQLSFGPYSFLITAPHSPGDILSPAQAQHLNSLRAEQIRGKLLMEYRKKLGQERMLSAEQYEEMLDLVAQLDQGFEWKMLPEQPPGNVSAFNSLLTLIKAENPGFDDYDVIEEATHRLSAQMQAAEQALEELTR